MLNNKTSPADIIFDKVSAETYEQSDNRERLNKIKRAMLNVIKNDLTKKQKSYIILYYRDGLNVSQIAKHCGVSISTVSRTLNRAKANILKYLKYI